MSGVEIIGYVASCLLLLAMMMTSVVKLRILNTIGCIMYIVYGLFIGSYPVALMNAAIACVNVVHIYRNLFSKHTFELLGIKNDDSLVIPFLNHYKADIEKNFPEFTFSDLPYACSYVIVRNMNIAGIFLATDMGNGNLLVDLDYVIPMYRDFKVGGFLFNTNRELFKSRGFKKITALSGSQFHTRYLKRVGFVEVSSVAGVKKFELDV
ncbi:MAG: YgjV family protein [Salinivirgaceae bacterium]|nr:YgjV family protein [Salinivirgaceae bacterium]